jgi:hypothetical protein
MEVLSEQQSGKGKWVGFARAETLEATWKNWIPLDIPAEAFAEHNRPASLVAGTQVLTWAETGKGMVVSGIGNRKTGEVRVVTRDATEQEFETFGHSRMPVVVSGRF